MSERKRRKLTPEERAEWARTKERSEAVWRRLGERLAYHKAKLAEERTARGE